MQKEKNHENDKGGFKMHRLMGLISEIQWNLELAQKEVKDKKQIAETLKKVQALKKEIKDSNQPAKTGKAKKDKEIYEIIFKHSPLGIALLDKKGTILEANPTVYDWTGYRPEEIIGKNALQMPFFTTSSKLIVAKNFFQRIRGKKVDPYEVTFKGKEGSEKVALLEAVLIKNIKGEVIQDLVMFTDITARKQIEEKLRESEERYRKLYEGSQDGYVLVDMEGNIKEFNESYRKMLGYSEKELYTKTYVDLTPEKWHKMEAEIVKKQIIPQGYSEIYQKEYRKKDGTIFPIELRTYLIKDKQGKPQAMWAFIRDVTKREKTEEELKNKVRELESTNKLMVGRELKMVEMKKEIENRK